MARPRLDGVNDAFHDAYGHERDAAAQGPPLFVVVADVLTLLHHGERRDFTFVPPLSNVIKSAAHAPVALYSLLHAGAPTDAFAAKLDAAIAEVPDLDDPAIPDVHAVLAQTAAWARQPTADRDDAARRLGPLLLRLTDHATRLQLARLDACVAEAVERLSAADLSTLTVVVTGDHQARARSLAMQYFERRLPPSKEDRDGTERVTYAEGASSVEEAVRLVGVQRFDAVIAKAFFGDASRLQRDVLGDSVAAQLAAGDFPRLDC